MKQTDLDELESFRHDRDAVKAWVIYRDGKICARAATSVEASGVARQLRILGGVVTYRYEGKNIGYRHQKEYTG